MAMALTLNLLHSSRWPVPHLETGVLSVSAPYRVATSSCTCQQVCVSGSCYLLADAATMILLRGLCGNWRATIRSES